MEKKLHGLYLKYYNLLTEQTFMASSFSLLTILLKEFRQLNENMYMVIKKNVILNEKIASAVLNTQMLKVMQYYTDVFLVVGTTEKIDENLKNRFGNT